MPLHTDPLRRTADTLEQALAALARTDVADGVMWDLYRNAAITGPQGPGRPGPAPHGGAGKLGTARRFPKSFELSLEAAGKLLRRALKAYAGNPREVDALVFNDVLRHAGRHALLDAAEVGRWLAYRANRNTTAHDYGEGFANETLKLLPNYLQDLRLLASRLQARFDAQAEEGPDAGA
jgi:hypothetical protein